MCHKIRSLFQDSGSYVSLSTCGTSCSVSQWPRLVVLSVLVVGLEVVDAAAFRPRHVVLPLLVVGIEVVVAAALNSSSPARRFFVAEYQH